MIDHVQAEIAGEEEAYRFLTRVMRGDLKEPSGKDVSVTDRLKACTGLMKRYETAPDAGAAPVAPASPQYGDGFNYNRSHLFFS